MKALFDHIGRAITSLAAVIFVMLMTITGMILFSHTLFATVFPAGMEHTEKIAATWFMALGWEFTVLITTCNVKHIHKNIPVVMAVCSGVIVLFFIQAFDGYQTPLVLTQRWFVGILAATINYIYAELFYKKWSERNNFIELPLKVNELQSKVDQLKWLVNDQQRTIHESELAFIDSQERLKELQRFKKQIESELTCKHCGVIQSNFGTLHAHKGHCVKNPLNQKNHGKE